VYGLLKVSWGKILSGIIPDIRRIFKIKIAGIRLFARLFKPCKTLYFEKGGVLCVLRVQNIIPAVRKRRLQRRQKKQRRNKKIPSDNYQLKLSEGILV